MEPRELESGDVVQLNPETTRNPAFRGCLMTVSEAREWGAQGYVQSLGTREKMGGQAYYRSKWEDMEYVGRAVWEIGSGTETDAGSGTEGGGPSPSPDGDSTT